MDEETIEVFIYPDGRVELKVHGVKGSDCTLITEALENSLGGSFDRELTPEYYEHRQEQSNKKRLGY